MEGHSSLGNGCGCCDYTPEKKRCRPRAYGQGTEDTQEDIHGSGLSCSHWVSHATSGVFAQYSILWLMLLCFQSKSQESRMGMDSTIPSGLENQQKSTPKDFQAGDLQLTLSTSLNWIVRFSKKLDSI